MIADVFKLRNALVARLFVGQTKSVLTVRVITVRPLWFSTVFRRLIRLPSSRPLTQTTRRCGTIDERLFITVTKCHIYTHTHAPTRAPTDVKRQTFTAAAPRRRAAAPPTPHTPHTANDIQRHTATFKPGQRETTRFCPYTSHSYMSHPHHDITDSHYTAFCAHNTRPKRREQESCNTSSKICGAEICLLR